MALLCNSGCVQAAQTGSVQREQMLRRPRPWPCQGTAACCWWHHDANLGSQGVRRSSLLGDCKTRDHRSRQSKCLRRTVVHGDANAAGQAQMPPYAAGEGQLLLTLRGCHDGSGAAVRHGGLRGMVESYASPSECGCQTACQATTGTDECWGLARSHVAASGFATAFTGWNQASGHRRCSSVCRGPLFGMDHGVVGAVTQCGVTINCWRGWRPTEQI